MEKRGVPLIFFISFEHVAVQNYSDRLCSYVQCSYLAFNLFILKAYTCTYNYQVETNDTKYIVQKDKLEVSPLEISSTETFVNSQQLNQRLCSPFGSAVNMLNSTVQSRTKRSYRVVEPPLSAAVSRACSGMFDRRRVLWRTGPPGSGKTTLAKRFQDYGFMAMDCEDPWANMAGGENRTKNLIRASQFVLENGTTTHVFAACYVKILWSKPPSVDVAVLFPSSQVYRERWMARNPNDPQKPDKQWKLTSSLIKRFEKDASIHVIHQSSSVECKDQTIYKICNKILSREE